MAIQHTVEENKAIIIQVANDMGEDPCIFLAFAQIESNFNNTVINSSGFAGLFQLSTGFRPAGASDDDTRLNSTWNTNRAIQYYQSNKKTAIRNGISWEPWMGYLMHQQGGGGGTYEILHSNDLLSGFKYEGNIRNNLPSKYKNIQYVCEFIDIWKNRFNSLYDNYKSSGCKSDMIVNDTNTSNDNNTNTVNCNPTIEQEQSDQHTKGLLSNEIDGRQDLLDQSKLMPVGAGNRVYPNDSSDRSGQFMIAPASDAFSRMVGAAKSDGFTITPDLSAFRSFRRQQELWDSRKCDKCVAQPGYSRHGWGRAVDIAELGLANGACPTGNKELLFNWLKSHAGDYGFFHPKWAEDNCFEPWHFEYNGVDSNPAVNATSPGDVAHNNSTGYTNCTKDNSGAGTGTGSDVLSAQDSANAWMKLNDYLLGTGNGKLADLVDKPATEKNINNTAVTQDDKFETIVDPGHPKDDIIVGKEENNTQASDNQTN